MTSRAEEKRLRLQARIAAEENFNKIAELQTQEEKHSARVYDAICEMNRKLDMIAIGVPIRSFAITRERLLQVQNDLVAVIDYTLRNSNGQ